MSRKRQDLMERAEVLFYENGFHGVGLKRVVSEAGVALMTLYNHFESKEDLIMAVLTGREERYFSLLNKAVEAENSDNQADIAMLLAKSHINWLRTEGKNGCMFLRAKEEYTFENEDIVNQVIAHKETLISFFQKHNITKNQAVQLTMLLEGATALAEVGDLENVENNLYSLVKMVFEK
ncbi:TetR/AcrR family transcriptional regulator [Jeotgalibacillus proteolyticus]|uniref:TetR/AcrR family transcriptional regulator n=1 Tax=Jeotgalibacillus proteolyticus TaxID=2082395 RepID=A0A2S5GBY8_9BACL|nr:TetR/AcrR family transcriptional regulator [Jeotgalibacillus proteolyticus]PPA70431.1 TetR/AcrR family transcriptional regulator [Jeotgalibacillus proteolyticus]